MTASPDPVLVSTLIHALVDERRKDIVRQLDDLSDDERRLELMRCTAAELVALDLRYWRPVQKSSPDAEHP